MGFVASFQGCGEVTGLPSAEPIPVLQGLLVVGETRHLLQVRWSGPAHQPYEPSPIPVESSVVDLWLAGPLGDSVRYTTTGLPGEFAALGAIAAGERYRLSGTIAGRAVSAQAGVPGPLIVREPVADTLRRSLDDHSYLEVPFAWRADSAAAYQAFLVRADGTMHPLFIRSPRDATGLVFDIAPDTTGHVLIDPAFTDMADTARLVIMGYDRRASAFFSSRTKGNVHGAFGLFGAAVQTEKVLIWE